MQRAVSSYLFASQRLTPALLEEIQTAEIPLIEIYCSRQHIDYRNRTQISELGLWFRDSRLKVHSMHAPTCGAEHTALTISEPVKSKRLVVIDEIKRALEIADTVPYRYLIQHLGAAGEAFTERAVDAAFTALEELKLFAKHLGVEILLENIPGELCACEGLLTFLDRTHLDLNFCLDIGHAHLHEGVGNAYRLLKPRIRSTHVHDNNGEEDAHAFPFQDKIDWTETMELLRSAGDQYPLLQEVKESPETPNVLDAVRRTFDQLEELKPQN